MPNWRRLGSGGRGDLYLDGARLFGSGRAGTTVAAGAGAGTAPPAPTLTRTPTDTQGVVQSGTGTSPAAGVQATVTFKSPYPYAPVVQLSPANAAAAPLQVYATNVTVNGFDVAFAVAPAASQGATQYQVAYSVRA